jgi:predicted nucleic acid-binding protein
MSTRSSIRIRRHDSGRARDGGLIDTSVAVELEAIDRHLLPSELAISAVTLAELASGPHAAGSEVERRRRRGHLRVVKARVESLEFDSACAHAYARIYRATEVAGRKARGGRALDLLIAATALAHDLPLYTLNAADLRGLEDLIEIVDLG